MKGRDERRDYDEEMVAMMEENAVPMSGRYVRSRWMDD
jgi:hypothetical protein